MKMVIYKRGFANTLRTEGNRLFGEVYELDGQYYKICPRNGCKPSDYPVFTVEADDLDYQRKEAEKVASIAKDLVAFEETHGYAPKLKLW